MKAIGNFVIENEPIGKGQFCQVFRCTHSHRRNDYYAVKVVEKTSLTTRLLDDLKNEIISLTKIYSPHVVRLMDI
jgi:serine/threonine-protein kinase ULK2